MAGGFEASGGSGLAYKMPRDEPGSIQVRALNLQEAKARVSDAGIDLPIWIAACEPPEHGREPVLPAADGGVGGPAVLEEQQAAVRAENAADLAQGGIEVGNGAQRPGGDHGVHAAGVEGNALGASGEQFYGERH